MSLPRRKRSPKSSHYVDNTALVAEVVSYKVAVQDALARGLAKPQMSDKLGNMIWQIAERFSSYPSFARYTYRDEMIAAAVENCLTYVTNFDPAKSNNAFAYFTQIMYYSFLRTIAKENRQSEIKQALIDQAGVPTLDEVLESAGMDPNELHVKHGEHHDNSIRTRHVDVPLPGQELPSELMEEVGEEGVPVGPEEETEASSLTSDGTLVFEET